MTWRAVLAACLMAGPVCADTAPLRTLDDEYAAKSWRAVGRVDMGNGRAFCSGTLIAPDLVLTAAHCLYRPGTNQLFHPEDIVFHAGLRKGQPVTSRRAKAASAHNGFQPNTNVTLENVRYDVGLIRLERPIPTHEIPPFKVQAGELPPGPVSVVSYGRGRSETQSRQKSCQLTHRMTDVLFFDCASVPGTSGAPVFSHRNGRGQIVAVVSGAIRNDDTHHTLGMRLPDRVAEVKRQLRMQVRAPVAKMRRIDAGQRSAAGGAKFVRPGGS